MVSFRENMGWMWPNTIFGLPVSHPELFLWQLFLLDSVKSAIKIVPVDQKLRTSFSQILSMTPCGRHWFEIWGRSSEIGHQLWSRISNYDSKALFWSRLHSLTIIFHRLQEHRRRYSLTALINISRLRHCDKYSTKIFVYTTNFNVKTAKIQVLRLDWNRSRKLYEGLSGRPIYHAWTHSVFFYLVERKTAVILIVVMLFTATCW